MRIPVSVRAEGVDSRSTPGAWTGDVDSCPPRLTWPETPTPAFPTRARAIGTMPSPRTGLP
ncbi:hypothetical protein ACFQ51_05130 [Streptomyces kaempferi]